MAHETELYAIIAYTPAGEGYGSLHIRPWVYVTEHGLAHYHRKAKMTIGSTNVALRSVGVAQTTLYNGTTAEVLKPV